jgi:hypothetical protein
MKKYHYHFINLLTISIIITFILVKFRNENLINLNHYDGDNQWLTASTIKFVNNWLYDGVINDKFIMYEDFKSIEFENSSRKVYNSYPPGCIIPVYIYSKLLNLKELTIKDLKYFIFYEYIICAILFGIFFYIFLFYLKFKIKSLIILLPIILALFWAYLPFNFYYFKNVYFSDIAIIPITIIFLINELLRKISKNNIILKVLSFLIVFIGVLTDYYFISLALSCFCIRIIYNYKEDKLSIFKSLILGLRKFKDLYISIILSLLIFFLHITFIPNGIKLLVDKFNERTSSSIDGTMFIDHNVKVKSDSLFTILRLNFGTSIPSIIMYFTLALFILSICILLSKKYKIDKIVLYFCLIISSSCIIHSMLLYNHTMRHEFSILKFCTALVFFLFILLYYFINIISKLHVYKKYTLFIVTIILIVPFINYFLVWDDIYYKRRTRQFNLNEENLSKFIRLNTKYNDVVFSPYYEININPPLNLSISQKRVYKIEAIQEVKNYNLVSNSKIVILLNKDSVKRNMVWMVDSKKIINEENGWMLYKIN